jgi:hypothetical protein
MSLTKIAGSGSGVVSQRYGFENLDPYQNVTDPEHLSQLHPNRLLYL